MPNDITVTLTDAQPIIVTLDGAGIGSNGGAVDSVNGKVGTVVLDADDISDSSTTNKFVTAADLTILGNTSGTNTGDQTTITGNAGTATALETARNINGVSFDGTADITVADSTKIPTSYLDTDGTLTANSDTKIASQKAVKTYADTKLALKANLTGAAFSGAISATQIASYLIGQMAVKDVRPTDPLPSSFPNRSVQYQFKNNALDGLVDGGSYHHTMAISPWGDDTGGKVTEVGYTENNNVWTRKGARATNIWGAWQKQLNSGDIDTTTTLGTSDTKVPSQKAVKQYVDVEVAPSTVSAMVARHPALSKFQTRLTNVRAVPSVNWSLSQMPQASLFFLGDSITEGYGEIVGRSKRWIDLLSTMIGGKKGNVSRYIPASANLFPSLVAADWPGKENPWTYTGTVTSGGYGNGGHSAKLSANSSASINFNGTDVMVYFTKTAASSNTTPATLTIDGVTAGTINAYSATTTHNNRYNATIGAGVVANQFGSHTLTITCPTGGGEFNLQGISVRDGTNYAYGIPFNGVVVIDEASKAGLASSNYASASPNTWDGNYLGADLNVIMLGANDPGVPNTAAQYQANLVTIMNRLDAKAGVTTNGYLLLLPDSPGMDASFRRAVKQAAFDFDPTGQRAVGLPLKDLMNDWQGTLTGKQDGTDSDPTHLNEWGHQALAQLLYGILDRSPEPRPLTPSRSTFTYLDVPAWRNGWTENISSNGDTSPNNTTVNQMTYRMWFDAGTYKAVVKNYHNSAGGNMKVSINWTDCGTVDTYNATSALTQTALGTAATIVAGMWGYVTVTALGTKNVSSTGYGVTFSELAIRKTA